AQSRDGAELLPRPSRSQRRAPAPGQATRREDRHEYRFAPHLAPRQDSLWNPASAPSLAHERRCSEHAPRRQVRETSEAQLVGQAVLFVVDGLIKKKSG